MAKQFMRALILTTGALSVGVSHAADVRGVFKAGFDFGGDTIVTAFMTDGGTETIKANEGFVLGGGFAVFNDTKTLSSEITLSWKYTSISAENGDIEFTRFPVDALLFFNSAKSRLGIGATYHLNPEVEGSGVATGFGWEFDDALGFIAQVDYRASEKIAFGLRYTNLTYDVVGSDVSAKADGIGGMFTLTF